VRITRDIFLVLLTVVGGILGNLIAAYIQDDLWNNLFSPARIAGTIAGIVVIIVITAVIQQQQLSATYTPERVNSEFQNLWTKLAIQLENDIEKSIDSATHAIELASLSERRGWPHAHIALNLQNLVGRNWYVIKKFDPNFAKQLNRYINISMDLQKIVYRYKDVMGGHNIFDNNSRLSEIKDQMRELGLKLEDASLNLRVTMQGLNDRLNRDRSNQGEDSA